MDSPVQNRAAAPQRAARFFHGLGLFFFSLLATWAPAECGTRAADVLVSGAPFWRAEKTGALYMAHPFLFRVPRPGARFQRYHVNAHGFRGPEFSACPSRRGSFAF